MNTIAHALSAFQKNLISSTVESAVEIEDEDERDGLSLATQIGYTEAVDEYSNPTSLDDDSEELQMEERRAGLENDDEEWEEELVGLRPDNGYLPGQRMAEKGVDREILPKE